MTIPRLYATIEWYKKPRRCYQQPGARQPLIAKGSDCMSHRTCENCKSATRSNATAYKNGYRDGYQKAHEELAEHEAKIYSVAFHSGFRAGNHAANQTIEKPGWAEK